MVVIFDIVDFSGLLVFVFGRLVIVLMLNNPLQKKPFNFVKPGKQN